MSHSVTIIVSHNTFPPKRKAKEHCVTLRGTTLTHASSAAHNLALFVLACIATPTSDIFSSFVAFLTRTLSPFYSTVWTIASNRFTIAFETSLTELRSSSNTGISHNLTVMFWLKKGRILISAITTNIIRVEKPILHNNTKCLTPHNHEIVQ